MHFAGRQAAEERDRRAGDAPSRLRREPAEAQADRRNLQPDEDGRRNGKSSCVGLAMTGWMFTFTAAVCQAGKPALLVRPTGNGGPRREALKTGTSAA